MSINEEVELLKTVPIFSKIEPAKLKLLAFTSDRMTFDAGQELCHQGDMGDAMYVILGGSADILIDSPTGPIKVAELQRNGFVGEMAILCDMPRTATVKAHERVTALKIPKEMFFRLVAEFPQMAVEIMRELAHRVEDMNGKLAAARAA
ncbi:cyclic nucleotide-binding domain-containing protein [Reyranella sp. CPCC 100927]|uniref:cyclic nucleotide-binding domain-containing protein n=1 Tax=Reyranella sp. CPCC 100927 TaxID=2599616 RepID=UPI0011B452EE|nr:cyclic nucleotide-binding domain-containing protein [Reyranella sp. CPCC 100927]TWT15054.1 cyclic nucleotide-binding domain-containing protein [Reyranella sp. CPCC 100927]